MPSSVFYSPLRLAFTIIHLIVSYAARYSLPYFIMLITISNYTNHSLGHLFFNRPTCLLTLPPQAYEVTTPWTHKQINSSPFPTTKSSWLLIFLQIERSLCLCAVKPRLTPRSCTECGTKIWWSLKFCPHSSVANSGHAPKGNLVGVIPIHSLQVESIFTVAHNEEKVKSNSLSQIGR